VELLEELLLLGRACVELELLESLELLDRLLLLLELEDGKA
jgi:hypothetical protein